MSILLVSGLLGVLLAGLTTGSQAAILTADQHELRDQQRKGKRWAARAGALLDSPERLFGTARLGLELSLLGSVALVLISAWTAWGLGWSLFSVCIFLFLFNLFGERLPPVFAVKHALRLTPAAAWILTAVRWLFWPWIGLERALVKLENGEGLKAAPTGAPLITRQELAWMIRGEEEGGGVLRDERRMIDRIFHFSESQVREVMIPLIDVSAIEETATVREVIGRVDREGFSRFPVYSERIDRMFGIVHSFDFLESSSLDAPVTAYIRQAPFVPESMPVDKLMLQMQRDGSHMAIVVDEYGGSVGIVTMEDLLEEIVGEIEDEHDVQRVLYRRLSAHQLIVSARMEIDEVNELLGLRIPKEDYETLGGFLLKYFGGIPKEGESTIFQGVRFTVGRADERSLREVLITMPKPEG
jgi:putative hemolysin